MRIHLHGVYAGAVLLRAGVALLSIQSGFLEYNADGFTRTLHAWAWQQAPYFTPEVWLPLHFWVVGSLLHVWNDLYLVPRLINLLCSFGTLANLLLLGRALGGPRVAALTVLLVAVFPWEVWFSLSGMSESIFHCLLSGAVLTFVLWAERGQGRLALLAAGLLLLATSIRYEAWFYSIVFVLILLALRRRQLRHCSTRGVQLGLRHWLPYLLIAVVPFAFIALWVGASFAQFGDPLSFVRATSQINAAWSPPAAQLDLLSRVLFYPGLFLTLAPPLFAVEAAGLLWLLLRQHRRGVLAYAGLLSGELLLFLVITSFYDSIAPGSDRYLVSVLLLLLPCAAVVVDRLLQAANRQGDRGASLRYVSAVFLLVGLLLYSVTMTIARSNDYPSGDMRQVAGYLRARFSEGTLPPDSRIVVNLPADSERANARYAFQVLSNHPDNFDFLPYNDVFNAVAGTSHPRIWIVDHTTGNPNPPQGIQSVVVGQYTVELSGPQATLTASATQAGGRVVQVDLVGTGYPPGARVGVWVTSPAQQVTPLGQQTADAAGQIQFVFQPSRAQALEAGNWAATGQEARDGGLVGVAWFRLAGTK